MNFNGKVVLVTGASSGIGAAIAIKFAENGAKVTLVGRNKKKLDNVTEICTKAGTAPLPITADLTKDDDVRRVVDETIKVFGMLDVLINNAGIGGLDSILDENAMTLFDRVMATNLRSAVYITNLAAPHLMKSKGNIINISSVTSMTMVGKGHFSYATSKAGLDHFTRCVALELASNGVRVNSVNPGSVKTDGLENLGMVKEQVDFIWNSMRKTTALDRVCEPEDVVDLVLYLASEKAKGITGSICVVDNGSLLKGSIKLPEINN